MQLYLDRQLRDPAFRAEWEKVCREGAVVADLTKLRVAANLTQAELAEAIGTTQSALSRLEHHPPHKETPLLRKLADFYRCDIAVEIRLVPKAKRR